MTTLVRQDTRVSESLDAGDLYRMIRNAVRLAGVPCDAREDVSQALALEVLRRHGPNPERSRVTRSWLCVRARGHWIDQLRARERATGQFAAARELNASDDDPVIAAAMDAVQVDARALTIGQIAACLPNLTARQRDAVRVWLDERHEPLSNLERQHFHAAMRKLREMTRDEIYAAMMGARDV